MNVLEKLDHVWKFLVNLFTNSRMFTFDKLVIFSPSNVNRMIDTFLGYIFECILHDNI
jgi:hypothetical protein